MPTTPSMQPEEVAYRGEELLKQVSVGVQRVGALRESVEEMSQEIVRIRDNQELVERQKRLLEGQQETMFDLKKLVVRVQSDNEAMRVEHSQLRTLRDMASQQRAEASTLEMKHRKQLEGQAELVANVRSDLVALSTENGELRRQCAASKKQLEELQSKFDSQLATNRTQTESITTLQQHSTTLEQEYQKAIQKEQDHCKKATKELRFKLLRSQQALQQLEESQKSHSEQLAEKDSLSAELEQQIEGKDTEIRTLKDRITDMHAALRTQGIRDDAESEIRELKKALADAETASASRELEFSKREFQFQSDIKDYKARVAASEQELTRHQNDATEAGERADMLAAKLAVTEASLTAKEELLKTRTERLRVLSTGQKTTGTAIDRSSRELILEEQLTAANRKLEKVELAAKQQIETAARDRTALQSRVEELLSQLESLTAE
eukprot:TRINITY_DN33813_c0_g1_i1.p1 TRINITY_DN33813_c0_g1~~TRINITY_DN33813_c0_g1_i1.p1  ORF type:complete len:439 (+),score=129.55 TRINITY_DN33813_c0_g1_i1:52-1368(+)